MGKLLVVCLGLALAVPCAAQGDRWQLTLRDGMIVWDLQLEKLAGDTLVARHRDSTFSWPLLQVDELRLVQQAIERRGAGGPGVGALSGLEDEVYQLTLLDLGERRGVVQKIFADHPPQAVRSP